MPPDPADLINTILAATPTADDEAYQRALRAWFAIPADAPADPAQLWRGLGETYAAPFRAAVDAGRGDPRPIAARQAAAALRWAADFIRDDEYAALGEDRLRELADQLDTQETP